MHFLAPFCCQVSCHRLSCWTMQSASWLPTKQTQKHWENAKFYAARSIWLYMIWFFLCLFVASVTFFSSFFFSESVMLFGTKALKTTYRMFKCGVTSVSGLLGGSRSFEKGWAIMALGASTPVWRRALFFCVCLFFFSVEDVIGGVLLF